MSRPATKTDLVNAANDRFGKLCERIDSMSDELQNSPFSSEMATVGKEAHWSRDKNVRDVLIHLYEWHQLLLSWINSNRSGESKPFLPEPYNWRTYPEMNMKFWEKHQQTPLADAKKMLSKSHKNVMKLIGTFSNEDLFSKKAFIWTGTSTLGAYCVSATSSHYDWALNKIKRHNV